LRALTLGLTDMVEGLQARGAQYALLPLFALNFAVRLPGKWRKCFWLRCFPSSIAPELRRRLDPGSSVIFRSCSKLILCYFTPWLH